jgi:hypothetical protein
VNKKVLPLIIPEITTIPRYTNLEAILAANGMDYLPWFRSNFLQIRCPKKVSMSWIDIDYEPLFFEKLCPLIDYRAVPKDLIDTNRTIDFFIKCIDHNHYIYTVFDRYYVPVSVSYGKQHQLHDSLVFGYDLEQEEFHIADFFEEYKFERLPFSQVESAFREAQPKGYHFTKNVELITLNPNYTPIFDLDLVIHSLKNYCLSRHDQMNSYLSSYSVHVSPEDNVYGLDVYDTLIAFLTNSTNIGYQFFRPLHLLWHHKKNVLQTINYLQISGILDKNQYISLYEDYSDIEKRMLINRNLMIKYTATKNQSHFDAVIKSLAELSSTEKTIIERLLYQLAEYKQRNGAS